MQLFLSVAIPSSQLLVPLPDTEPEPAATTARQTPMKAKTEERAILAVEKAGGVFFFGRGRGGGGGGGKVRRKRARLQIWSVPMLFSSPARAARCPMLRPNCPLRRQEQTLCSQFMRRRGRRRGLKSAFPCVAALARSSPPLAKAAAAAKSSFFFSLCRRQSLRDAAAGFKSRSFA